MKRANLAYKSMKNTHMQMQNILQMWPTNYSKILIFQFFYFTKLNFGLNRTKFNRLWPRLCWVIKKDIWDFYPILQKNQLQFETPCTSSYYMYTFAIIHVWYLVCEEEMYSNFLLKKSDFIDLSHFLLNHIFYNKNWKDEFVRALFLGIFWK